NGVPATGGTADLVRRMLVNLGEDASREGLRKTPERVEKSLEYLTAGCRKDPRAVVGDAGFEHEADGMTVVRDIGGYSLCDPPLLPFFGKAHVAYLPKGKIVGLSKLPRLVDCFARRLQVQERLTMQIAQAVMDILEPDGVGVVVEAKHL